MAILQNEIIEHLLTLIEQGRHGDMLPSQNELRKEFSVSTVTVRKALEKLEERGMIYRHQGKGCFIRRPGEQAAATRLFLLIPRKFSLADTFIAALVNATQQSAYHTIFYHYDGNEEVMLHELQRIAPQVVIWLAPVIYQHEKTLLKLLSMPLHVILFNREYDHPAINSVSGDFVGDGRMLGKLLIREGVRKALFLSHDMRVMYSKLRCAGLCEILESAGGSVVAVEEEMQFVSHNEGDGALSSRRLAAAAEAVLRQDEFDAVVCAQGELWDTMRAAVKNVGRPLERCWFATFNRLTGEQHFTTRIITMEQPVVAMAEESVRLVSRLLAGGKPERLRYPSEQERSFPAGI